MILYPDLRNSYSEVPLVGYLGHLGVIFKIKKLLFSISQTPKIDHRHLSTSLEQKLSFEKQETFEWRFFLWTGWKLKNFFFRSSLSYFKKNCCDQGCLCRYVFSWYFFAYIWWFWKTLKFFFFKRWRWKRFSFFLV